MTQRTQCKGMKRRNGGSRLTMDSTFTLRGYYSEHVLISSCPFLGIPNGKRGATTASAGVKRIHWLFPEYFGKKELQR